MRDDLLNAYAACDWAVTQLERLKERIADWRTRPAYDFVTEDRPEMGKKLIKLRTDERIGDRLINAEIGSIINSLRSALDMLGASLARRNGIRPTADHHFPFKPNILDFIDPLEVRERKKWLTDSENAIIESLKPYDGGDNTLWALHRLDVIRKHDRLIEFVVVPESILIDPEAYAQGLEFRPAWPGFQNDATIAWTNITATNYNFQIAIDIRFDEATLLANRAVLPTLRELWGIVSSIIQRFE